MSRAPRPTVRTRTDLLRLDGAVERDPAIDLWFSKHSGELGVIAQRWFTAMRQCGDEVRELLHDGCPTACLGDAPFAYVNAFTSHVNVGFFHGASLPDPAHLLQGQGKSMRHVKLKSDGTIVRHAKLQPATPASHAATKVATNVTNEAASEAVNAAANDAALAQLIAAAYSDIKSRVENG
jgi:hypothetical protein